MKERGTHPALLHKRSKTLQQKFSQENSSNQKAVRKSIVDEFTFDIYKRSVKGWKKNSFSRSILDWISYNLDIEVTSPEEHAFVSSFLKEELELVSQDKFAKELEHLETKEMTEVLDVTFENLHKRRRILSA